MQRLQERVVTHHRQAAISLCPGAIQPHERLVLFAMPCMNFGNLIGHYRSIFLLKRVQSLLRCLRMAERMAMLDAEQRALTTERVLAGRRPGLAGGR